MNLLLVIMVAATLPTFSELRRIDRDRRQTGQMQTPESLAVTRVDPVLINTVVAAHPADGTIWWGAAELLGDWSRQRAMFESALSAGGTNDQVALRFACAAARQHEFTLALTWFRYCQTNDVTNLVPWLGELWVLRQQHEPLAFANDACRRATEFRDYGIEASRARIKLLEMAGYSPYAARRLGVNAESMALRMVQEFSKVPLGGALVPFLTTVARAMQAHPRFFVTELVGQSLEGTLLVARNDPSSAAVQTRGTVLSERREDIKALVASVEQRAIDVATEEQMVRYFDAVLTDGEELAMKWLLDDVRRKLSR